ncbi:MAG: Gfo/Idh/MocA family oxidoreductase [Ignavibacteriales bacterium]|nr:Gfo/Idh/MocA family oxidoreductase [Ignavibacteriales bacterium]
MLGGALQDGRRDGQAHRLPVGAGRARPLQPEARLGLPDGQRRREPQEVAGICEPAGPRHRARAAQSQGPPRALPDQDGPGLPDLPRPSPAPRSRSSTTCTTSRSPRATSSPTSTPAGTRSAAFHVGDSPGRKEPGTGEMNYRNIFKHIHGKGYKGVLCLRARQEPQGPRGREGPARGLPRRRQLLKETNAWTRKQRQRTDAQGLHQDGFDGLRGRARGRRGRARPGAAPAARTRSASASSAPAAAARARPSTPSTRRRASRSWPSTTRSRTASTSSLQTLREKVPAAVKVTPETCFTGLDGYKKLLAIKDINYIVTAAPPGFRPLHLKAAVEAGKNVFMEKPVAVDPVGVRSVIASSELAAKKGLGIVAGTQRRHQTRYLETHEAHPRRGHRRDRRRPVLLEPGRALGHQADARDERDGVAVPQLALLLLDLGRPHRRAARPQHRRHELGPRRRRPSRSWPWAGARSGRPPSTATSSTTSPSSSSIPNGVRVASQCRQIKGCADRVEEKIVGTKGHAFGYGEIAGPNAWKFEADEPNPYVVEHTDLIAEHPGRQAPQRGPAHRREHDVRHHGPHERLHGPGHLLGLGHERLEARPLPGQDSELGPNPVDPVAVPGVTPLV